MTTLQSKKLSSLILIVACAVQLVKAQTPESTENTQVIVDQSTGGKISAISIVRTSEEPQDLSQMKTVTFSVPVEDISYYKYFVGKIKDSGAGWSSANPDEYGVIEKIVDPGPGIIDLVQSADINRPPVGRIEDNKPFRNEFIYYYLFAYELDTGNIYYTFDIPEVPLYALLNSLAASLSAGLDPRARINLQRQRLGQRVQGLAEEYGDTTLSLLGEKMSLEETLDRIFQLTGCEVYAEEFSLRVESCN